jgi:transposase
MKNREGGIVGYNVQVAVDAEHHLIVAHEVTNDGLDRHQLSSMAGKAKEAVSATELTVVADRGYFKSVEILECTQSGIIPLVPKSMTSNSLAAGRFDKQDFIYIAEDDEYRCPARQRAIWRFRTVEGKVGARRHVPYRHRHSAAGVPPHAMSAMPSRAGNWRSSADEP